MNNYLTGERYVYALLRYFRFLKRNGLNYRNIVNKRVIEEYIKELFGLRDKVIDAES